MSATKPTERTDDSAAKVALVTGVGRQAGIGNAVARTLSEAGWTVVTTGWRPYDEKMDWGADQAPLADFEADLSDPDVPAQIFHRVNAEIGSITALVMCHCESVDSSIATTTVESFDLHFAINARATWLLIKAFAGQFVSGSQGKTGSPVSAGRIIAITSDHTPFNLPYGASKGAMDRIVLAAAVELADRGVTANVINPGATDTGWMNTEVETSIRRRNLQPRIGDPQDCANLVRFLCSDEGQWINSQLLHSDGGKLP